MACNKLKLDNFGMVDNKGISTNNFPCYKSNIVSVSDLYSLQNCVERLTGQAANSISPTDIYKLQMNNIPLSPKDFKYDGEHIPLIFMKVFNTQLCGPLRKALETDQLLYEYLVYLTKIKNFTALNICPYFIKVLGGNLMVDYSDIKTFLRNVPMYQDGTPNLLTDNEKDVNLYRNMTYVLNQAPGRPSITATGGAALAGVATLETNAKYGYFMTEGTLNTTTLENFFTTYFTTYFTNVTQLNKLYIIFFQLLVACKTMSMAKLAHNDLHDGNVLVEERKTVNFNDTIVTDNDKIFSLQTPVRIHIYDFDRGYLEDYKNPGVIGVEYASQSNDLIEKRDLVKIMAYFFIEGYPAQRRRFGLQNVNPYITAFRENIANTLIGGNQTPDDKARLMMDFYMTRGAFLQNGALGSNTPNDFILFNRSFDDMLDIAYGLIGAANRSLMPICIPAPQTDIYYIKSSIFDQKGNIIHKELERIKSNNIKDYCVQTLARRNSTQIKNKDQQIQNKDQQIQQIRQQAQQKINQLNQQITQKDVEINQLRSQIRLPGSDIMDLSY